MNTINVFVIKFFVWFVLPAHSDISLPLSNFKTEYKTFKELCFQYSGNLILISKFIKKNFKSPF